MTFVEWTKLTLNICVQCLLPILSLLYIWAYKWQRCAKSISNSSILTTFNSFCILYKSCILHIFFYYIFYSYFTYAHTIDIVQFLLFSPIYDTFIVYYAFYSCFTYAHTNDNVALNLFQIAAYWHRSILFV